MKIVIFSSLLCASSCALSAGVYDFSRGTYSDGTSSSDDSSELDQFRGEETDDRSPSSGRQNASSSNTDRLINRAKAAVREDLLVEPDLVKFRSIRTVVSSSGFQVVCGEYNAINLRGEYQGFNKFAYYSGRLVLGTTFNSSTGISGLDAEIDRQNHSTLTKIRSLGCNG